MNIIYLNCGKYELDRKIIAVIDTTFAVVKSKPEKKIRLVKNNKEKNCLLAKIIRQVYLIKIKLIIT